MGSFRPNAFGLHDVLGNVWEWTEDCWNGDYSGAPVDGSAWRAGDCSNRVLRGGDWILWPTNLRAGFRIRNRAGFRFFHFGFRVARTLDTDLATWRGPQGIRIVEEIKQCKF